MKTQPPNSNWKSGPKPPLTSPARTFQAKLESRIRRAVNPVLMLLLLPALFFCATANAQAQTATQAPIVGEIERLTINNPNDVWSGGMIVVGGQNIIIPRNLLMDFPANRLTLQQTFSQAPPGCVARAESGLAKADVCNTNKTGGIATIHANRTSAGNIIAGDIFLQKGVESVKGVVTYINYTDGYFRLNGITGDANTGVMVRLNDPGNRHTVQQGLGCLAGSVNCSPDPRFTLDRDNYTNVFSTGLRKKCASLARSMSRSVREYLCVNSAHSASPQ